MILKNGLTKTYNYGTIYNNYTSLSFKRMYTKIKRIMIGYLTFYILGYIVAFLLFLEMCRKEFGTIDKQSWIAAFGFSLLSWITAVLIMNKKYK